jgi:AcrR family transcriptional regulator
MSSSRKTPRASAAKESAVPPRVAAVPSRHHGYKQHRSLQTFERLLTAAEELLSERPFDEVSVNDICARAGHSVGAFYRRFESREGLLHVLHERYTERVMHLQSAALNPARWEGIQLPEMLKLVIEEIIKVTRQNLGLLLATEHLAGSDRTVAAREGRIHDEFHAGMTRLILLRVESIDHPRPRTAAAFCAQQLRAALFYRLQLAGALQMSSDELTDREFVTELVLASMAYLGTAGVSPGAAMPAKTAKS